VLAYPGGVQTFQSIVTRHTARETKNPFPDYTAQFPGYTARILLAEDNITNQRVALGILKKLGLRADAVANGAEVLKALELLPYDLVLMDVQMPEMDGLEATGHIRNRQSAVRNHDIPIIAMTANAMQGDREICLQAGMNDYVSKPVSPQALAEALKKWLPQETLTTTAQLLVTPDQSSSDVGQDSELPVFDRAGMLSRLMDDEELLQVVVEGFLGDIPVQIEALQGFMESGDIAATERQAHTIKGASANVGGETLRAVACEMEKAAKAGDMVTVKTHISELVMQFEQLKKAMTNEL
jgi:CheY-like chemotaxis protein/HPt (histidine-containing phosphotransfer) domain-containing protein